MQARIWASTIPLHITHPSSPLPYLIQVPRVSYLPLLLPRLTLFFGPCSSFSYQDIPLKNLPVGLLCDLYQPELPWRLMLGDGPLFDIHDTYINSVKEVSWVPASRQPGGSDTLIRPTSSGTGPRRGLCRCRKRTLHSCGIPYKIVAHPFPCNPDQADRIAQMTSVPTTGSIGSSSTPQPH
jgi:hypothetical protein